ncbi:P-loop containing nucleoside triphosphate hydrolase protein [Lentithecium fluviatile CBS 122367]|uniref:P-loop containing nucleoside triphosphate hydrolase protein n=1 Tax=Lentithecium fluviatile CBS 122367 TaxID=1168545 RepID=A0A6G1IZH3_9PLEO|nr:P-loop containing nucleoside triphosphate hydrolase protein [Lentithecium fluviatile CBS 122367]
MTDHHAAKSKPGSRTNDPTNNPKPTIFVEVQLITHRDTEKKVTSRTEKWLRKNFAHLKVGQRIDDLRDLHSAGVRRLDVASQSECRTLPDDTHHSLQDNSLEFYLYTLHLDSDEDETASGDNEATQFSVLSLPHQSLDKKWESLVFEEPIKETTLRALMRAILESIDPGLVHARPEWQNTLIFHGPQGCVKGEGSGKTTLAQGLAQKLAIRLPNNFDNTQLLHVDAHKLFSRYFGQSAKNVGKLFDEVLRIAADENQLVIMIFDEVETLASSRECGLQKSEVADSMRATNQLLTGLDRLREFPNVVFIATTNLLSTIDKAFLDRCCIKQEIRNPSGSVSYEVLRGAINKRIDQGLVRCDSWVFDEGNGHAENTMDDASLSEELTYDHATSARASEAGATNSNGGNELAHIPDLALANMLWPHNAVTVSSELQRIAVQGTDVSARKWSHLVNWARYAHTVEVPCGIRDLLAGLEKVLEQELGRTLGGVALSTEQMSDSMVEVEMKDLDHEEVYFRTMESFRARSG